MAENLGSVYAEIRLKMDRLSQDVVQVRSQLVKAAQDIEKNGQETANALQRGLQKAAQVMRNVGQTFADYATDIGRFLKKAFSDTNDQVAQETQKTTRSLEEVIASTRQMRREFSQSARAVRKNMMELAINADQFAGKTDDFIKALTKLGQEHKKITDQMLANNELAKASFISTIGTIMARTNQSVKIADNLARLGNPLRTLDQVLLRSIGNRLDELAKRGNVAVVALRELGPTANMKQLRDQIMLINQGIMRMNMLAMVSGGIFAALTIGAVNLSNAIDGRLVPAFEQFKATWVEALRPFITAFTEVGLVILKAGTSIGNFFAQLAQNQPVLSAMIFGFMYLFTALSLLLSPLAIGISRTGSLAVAFNQLWMTIGPLVKGFLTVAGTAAIVSGAITVLAGVIYKLWTSSEAFRNSVINAWNAIKDAIMTAIQPIIPAWENLKQAFLNLVATIIGAEPNMSSIWKTLGDKIATFINWFTANAVPVLQQAFTAVANFIATAMNVAAAAFNKIADWWKQYGPWIKETVSTIFKFIADTVLFYINNVKNIIDGAIKVITGIIKFFVSVLTGDWKGAWEAVKQIVSGAVQAIWGLFNLWIVGKITSLISGFVSKALGLFGQFASQAIGNFTNFVSRAFSSISQWASGMVSRVTSAMSNFGGAIAKGIKAAISDFARFASDVVRALANLPGQMVSIGKNIVQGLWNGIASLGGWLRSKIMSWAKAAIPGPIADLLGIQSPSRLMMEYGRNIAQGLAIGLERARNLVRDASEQLAGLTVTAMSSPALAAQAAGTPTTTTTSQVVHQNAPLLVIQNLTVRNESDIRRIEDIMRQLYAENMKRLRARGQW